MSRFDLDKTERNELWDLLQKSVENYYENTDIHRVSPILDYEKSVAAAQKFDFTVPLDPIEAAQYVIKQLQELSVHNPHPSYFGLFNPRPSFPSVLSDTISAFLNLQLAAWSHAPFGVEVENYLVQQLGQKFGYKKDKIDGVFATGGAEANLTAVLTALNKFFPEYANIGLQNLNAEPVIYCSSESHHSLVKAARIVGLGLNSVRTIRVNPSLQLDIRDLTAQIEKDLKQGKTPMLVVGTAGTTGSGVIDPLNGISEICRQYNLWFHVDAAFGGGAVLSQGFRSLLDGIEKSDSITIDVHKWLSVPMGASLFLTSHKEVLHQTFRVSAEYMPKEAEEMDIIDPFTHSIQWSRRFIGLKLYLPLLTFGWRGFAKTIDHHFEMGFLLKKLLEKNKWKVYNETELPILCFSHETFEADKDFCSFIAAGILSTGKAWLSLYKINGINTLRACITNYATTEKEINQLIELLNTFREQYISKMIK